MGSANINREQDLGYSKRLLQVFILGFLFLFLPSQSFATSSIAAQVAAACAPDPTMPDVGSCSACHSTTNNRGPNDLTTAGTWSLSASTFNLFCPTATTPPGTPTPTPPPATPPPGSPATPTPSPTPGMGGSGAPDDDDDDEGESDDDDDDGASAGSISSRLSALRARIRAFIRSR